MSLTEAWFAAIAGARWFQDKGVATGISRLEPLAWLVQEPGCWIRSELATVTTADGDRLYHLVVAYLTPASSRDGVITATELDGFGPALVVDATRFPATRAALWRGLTAAAGVRWLAAPPQASGIGLFGGEQSNTNLEAGPALVKIFRKLTPGPSLDAEVLAALTGSGLTPGLLAAWQDEPRDLVLGLVMERVQDAEDGWEWATRCCRDGVDVQADFARLGAALRELHARLAAAFGAAALPGPEVAARLEAQVEAVAADLPELAGYRPAVERALVGIGQGPIAVQRLHGDFHLGQTLISPAGWTILDFEGEPLKTPAQRREMDSRWRDVAGLVRSIDYARSSHPDPASPAATAWAEQSRAAFLAAYDPDQFGPPGNPVPAGLQALTSSLPAPLAERPPAPGSPPRLLAAYEAAKACYELLYEARNRPAWLPIPLGALKRL